MENSECDQIPVIVSNVIKEGTLPCPTYISVTASRPEKLEYILFQNYYVSSINIQQLTRENRWVTILTDFKLTHSPHFENDAENWCIVPATFFNEHFMPGYFKEIRIYFVQPSPNWKEFCLRNVSCYTIREKPVVKKNEPLSAFSRLRERIQEKVEVINSAAGNDLAGYEETLNGNVEVSRLEVSQLQ
jgi:hypothetical protein